MGSSSSFIRIRRDLLTDLKALSVIPVFFLFFFWRVFLRGDLPLIGDPMAYSLPLRSVAWEMIRSGTLPLWIPYVFSGYPLLSMAQLGIAYPLTWGYLFLPAAWAETIYVLAPFLLAPVFTYAYTRALGLSRAASIVAGLGFTYGGMMASRLSIGMMPNAVMWLPLLLIAIERSRTSRFMPCLVAGAAAYSLSVLTGIGQGFLLVGLVAGGYAVFVAAWDLQGRGLRGAWRPVGVAAGSLLFAPGVAAFQILETWPALELSIRSELSYEIFGQLSYRPLHAWLALWIPLYYHIESAPYLAPLVLVLAAIGVIAAARRRAPGNHQVIFWCGVVLIAGILMLGVYTPLYRLVYHLPVLNKFRGPSRHSFEWGFALAVLAAYGWEAMAIAGSRAGSRLRALAERRALTVAIGVVLLALSAVAAVMWWGDIEARLPIDSMAKLEEAAGNYARWKIAFVALTAGALVCLWRLGASRARAVLLVGCFAWMCFVEAYFFMAGAWMRPPVPAAWFEETRAPTRFLQERLKERERVYLRVVGFGLRDLEPANLDFLNLAARHGLHNIAGYEPLIFERYSRALGDVWLDGVRKVIDRPLDQPMREPDLSLFDPRSHVIDLLNTRIVAGYTNLDVSLPSLIFKEGIPFAAGDFVSSGSSPEVLTALRAEGDTLFVVSTLAHSGAVADGERIAKLAIHTADGRIIERELLAGRDTAEWAHEREDVARVIKHRLAPVFLSYPGDEHNTFPAHAYWTRIDLGARVRLDRIEITGPQPPVALRLWKATLYDSTRREGTPLVMASPEKYAGYAWLSDEERWSVVYARDEVVMLENRRALPRAWMVGEAEAVSESEALAAIRGERPFDPRRTVLIEAAEGELPLLPGAEDFGEASVRIVEYEPNRIVIETKSERAGMLLVSEMSYPGWEAKVDGVEARIYTADYLLRAVAVGAGEHRVEMRYTAPGARRGAVISVCTLLVIFGMVVWSVASGRGRKERA